MTEPLKTQKRAWVGAKTFYASDRYRLGIVAGVDSNDWNDRIEANLRAIEELIPIIREEINREATGEEGGEGCVVLEFLLALEAFAVGASEIYERE